MHGHREDGGLLLEVYCDWQKSALRTGVWSEETLGEVLDAVRPPEGSNTKVFLL